MLSELNVSPSFFGARYEIDVDKQCDSWISNVDKQCDKAGYTNSCDIWAVK